MKIMGTGHRPSKLFFKLGDGYLENNPLRIAIRNEVRKIIDEVQPETIVSGAALGFDQDLARVAIEMDVPFIAAVPFFGQESKWPLSSQKRYHEIISKAKEIVYVSDPGYAPWKMHKRNSWMLDAVGDDGLVVACWNGTQGGTSSTVEEARRRKRLMRIINPDQLRAGLCV